MCDIHRGDKIFLRVLFKRTLRSNVWHSHGCWNIYLLLLLFFKEFSWSLLWDRIFHTNNGDENVLKISLQTDWGKCLKLKWVMKIFEVLSLKWWKVLKILILTYCEINCLTLRGMMKIFEVFSLNVLWGPMLDSHRSRFNWWKPLKNTLQPTVRFNTSWHSQGLIRNDLWRFN